METTEVKENLKEETDSLYLIQSLALIVGMILISAGLAAGSLGLLTFLVVLGLTGAAQLLLLQLQRLGAREGLLSDKKKNDWVTRWICAHLLLTTPEDDPSVYELDRKPDEDASDVAVRRQRLLKAAAGIDGVKRLRAVVATNLGLAYVSDQGSLVFVERNDEAKKIVLSNLRENIAPILLTQAAFLLALALVGAASVYLVWIFANLTVLSLGLELTRQNWTRAEAAAELRLLAETLRNRSQVLKEKIKNLRERRAVSPDATGEADKKSGMVVKSEELSLADLPAPRLRDDAESAIVPDVPDKEPPGASVSNP